jgi:hypothetical protein
VRLIEFVSWTMDHVAKLVNTRNVNFEPVEGDSTRAASELDWILESQLKLIDVTRPFDLIGSII